MSEKISLDVISLYYRPYTRIDLVFLGFIKVFNQGVNRCFVRYL